MNRRPHQDEPQRAVEARPPPRTTRRTVVLLVVICALGAGLRLALLRSTIMRLDADEAVTGLMAQRILDGHHLAFYAGQHYMGSAEQYLQALVLAVLPDTAFTLRLAQLGLTALATAGVYVLGIRVLRSPARGLLAAGIYAAGPFSSVFWGLKSRGAYMAGLLAALAGLIIAVSLSDGSRQRGMILAFGVACGFGFWSNWQSAYALLPAGVWVLGTVRKDLFRSTLLGASGFVIGALPALGHVLFTSGLEGWGSPADATLAARADGLVTFTLPLFFGFDDFGGRLVPWLPSSLAVVAPAIALGVAVWRRRGGITDLLLLRSSRRQPIDVLLLSGALAPVFYLLSPASGEPSPYYLFPQYVVMAVLLAAVPPAPERGAARPLVVGGAILALVFGQTTYASLRLLGKGGGGGRTAAEDVVFSERLDEVVAVLEQWDVDVVYADYWIAYPLQFVAGDAVVVAPIYSSRFPDLTAAAEAGPDPAFIVAGREVEALRAAIAAHGATAAEQEVGGIFIFRDVSPPLRPLPSLIRRSASGPPQLADIVAPVRPPVRTEP